MKNISETPKKGFAGLKAHFKDDLISGFSVSLIALPLCLGIAIASGVPPLAGLITAIVGGMIASRISGTFVTISGPAAGLIVITLGAAESMGGAGKDALYAGYPHALGAIVIGGLIMALFGLLKVGKVGDFFPSAAVHGMLAAIGVIIIIKQIFPAIGFQPEKGEILEVATQIPNALMHINPYAGAIALVSLVILIVHPMLKVKFIKLIPAPMWVLVATIPMAMGLGVENLKMVEMPHHLLGEGGIQFPSFEKIGESAFWVAVTGFALVSAIESLLSAKAVDSLDPYKRKSNLNKDLISMGGGSSLAAAIGGLPMISEIVRSSANVNNGAKTQWSNFFHGAFLLLFLLVGTVVIEMIPLSALAAMLVFTGFRLAHPREFKHMAHIGKAEITAFIITIIAVLATDLIIGILVGIIATYIFTLLKGAPFGNLFKVKGDLEGDTLALSGFLSFSNYLSLKKKLDTALMASGSLKVDFANVQFIDHTVMHHIEDYQRSAKEAGKEIAFLNMEGLNQETSHSLSARSRKGKAATFVLNDRTIKMLELATKHQYQFVSSIVDYAEWDFYSITTRKKIISIDNLIKFSKDEIEFEIADIRTKLGAQTSMDFDVVTGIKIRGVENLPKFYTVEETLIDRLTDKILGEDINFDSHPTFSKNYVLKGVEKEAVRDFFSEDVLNFFEANLDCFPVCNGTDLFLRKRFGLLSTKEIEELAMKASEFANVLQKTYAVQ